MTTELPTPPSEPDRKPTSPTKFFLRGLAISLPPILTIVILIWLAGIVYDYIIGPTSTLVRFTIAKAIDQSQPTSRFETWEKLPPLEFADRNYRITPEFRAKLQARIVEEEKSGRAVGDRVPVEWITRQTTQPEGPPQVFVPFGDRAVPYRDFAHVAREFGPADLPASATGVYMELVTITYFKSLFHLSAIAVLALIVLLYFLGRFVTARLGAWVVHRFETGIMGRLPLISNVYGSVKQVTDFFLSERTIEYNRVVAVEYPRRGIWSIGFVTSDSFLELAGAAGEPLVSILMPTSPMPMTGFTVNVPRSEILDLNITLDQAFQFCLSCGVLVPVHQRVTPELLQQELSRRLTASMAQGRRNDVPKLKPAQDSDSRSP